MAQKGPAPFLVGHGNQNRQTAVFLHRQQSGPALLKVGHGLNHYQVSPSADRTADLLGEDVYRRLKIQGAGGFQKLADGSQVQRSQDPPCRRLFGDGDGRGDYLFHRLSHAFELLSVGAEGVGAENLGSRLHIGAMNLQKPARVFQCGQLRMFAQSQSLGLEHGAHAAV